MVAAPLTPQLAAAPLPPPRAVTRRLRTGATETTAAGEPFTIGFTNPLGSNDQLAVLQRAIEARAECLGGTVVSLDSNLDVDKQISDIDQLVSQNVDGIVVFPLDAQAVIPAVERARDAGIKTVGVNVTLEDPDGRRRRALRRLRQSGHRADGDRDG